MKTILVPTDLTKNATHASHSAVRIAEQLHCRLLLWNCYPKVPVMPTYLGGTMAAQIIAGPLPNAEKLEKAAAALADFITDTDGRYRPQVMTCTAEGNLQQELKKLLQREKFEMMVIGATTGHAATHLLTGSDTRKIIEMANCPVLVVPHRAGLDLIERVVFATAYDLRDMQPITYLQALSKTIGFSLELVHVMDHNTAIDDELDGEENFRAKLLAMKLETIPFKQIKGKQVVNRLDRLIKETRADLLAMTHHQYGLLTRLFSDSTTKKELAHQRAPVLLFPLKT